MKVSLSDLIPQQRLLSDLVSELEVNRQLKQQRVNAKAAFVAAASFFLISPAAYSQSFSASPAKPDYDLTGLGRDPASCARFQEIPGTTARLFDYAASGTREGALGRKLEQGGFARTTGDCGGKGIVLFLYNSKLDRALQMANELASQPQPLQGGAIIDDNQPITLRGGAN